MSITERVHGAWQNCGKALEAVRGIDDVREKLRAFNPETEGMIRGLWELGVWTDEAAAQIVPGFNPAVYRRNLINSPLVQFQRVASNEYRTRLFRFAPTVQQTIDDTYDSDSAFRRALCERVGEYFRLVLDKDRTDGNEYAFYLKLWADYTARLTDDATELVERYENGMAGYLPAAWGDSYREVVEAFFARVAVLSSPNTVPYAFFEQKSGVALHLAGTPQETREAYRRLSSVYEKFVRLLGDEHPYTISALYDLADMTRYIGRTEKSAGQMKSYLRLCQRFYGEHHEKTVEAMKETARLLEDLGRENECLRLYQDILRIRRETLGDEAEETLTAMRDAAFWLDKAKRREEAAKLRMEALAARKKFIDDARSKVDQLDEATLKRVFEATDDAYFLITLEMGEDSEAALSIKEEVLDLCREILGTENEELFAALDDMAWTLVCTSKWDEVIGIRKEILATRIEKCGAYDERTLQDMEKLADDLEAWAERPEEAREVRERILAIRRENLRECLRDLGEADERTLEALKHLALCLDSLGEYDEVIKIREAVLAIRRKTSDEDDEETINAMRKLAWAMEEAGRVEEQLQIQGEILSIYRKKSQDSLGWAIDDMEDVADQLREMEGYDEELQTRKNILALCRIRCGNDDSATINAMESLACLLNEGKEYSEELPLRQEALAWYRKNYGAESESTLNAMRDTEQTLMALGRYEDAVALCREIIDIRERNLGKAHSDTIEARHSLEQALEAAGQSQEPHQVLKGLGEVLQEINHQDNTEGRQRQMEEIERRLVERAGGEHIIASGREADE